MPGGTRRAYFESPQRPDWRKRAAWEGNNPVFTPAEYRSMDRASSAQDGPHAHPMGSESREGHLR